MRPQPTWHLAWLGIVCVAYPAQAEEMTAVLTELKGTVTVSETSPVRGRAIPPRRAQVLQIVGMGDEIHVSTGAGASFVCSSDQWVELPENQEQRLTEKLCRNGKPLPVGTYRRLAPAAGRMASLKGVNVLEGETRGPEDEAFGVPHLLSPRNTSVLDGRPIIQWTQVQEAVDYEIKLTGPAPFWLRLDAGQVSCEERLGDVAVCSVPWPPQAQDLPAGTTSFLSVGARLGLAAPLREEPEPRRIQRLSKEKAEKIRSQLDSLSALPLDDATRLLLEADLYARGGLLADAIPAYRKALTLQNAPEVRVTLGDAYLKTGLLRLAARSYKEVLDGKPSPAVRAACELGLGRIEYIRNNFEQAACHLRKARDLYRSLGLKEEAALAERAMKEAEKKQPG
jgi:hypothetical protein